MKKFIGLCLAWPRRRARTEVRGLRTPQMGWNSWNKFACNVNEQMIRETADAMVTSGMKDAGYVYVNIDDCWHGERDAKGFIHPNAEHFPSGMKALSDYVHSKGLKLGLYSDAGWKTCGGRPGSRGYEFQDALTYAEWGIDYLKYDWCDTNGLKAEGAYLTMREALRKAGRPVLFSICEWGDNKPRSGPSPSATHGAPPATSGTASTASRITAPDPLTCCRSSTLQDGLRVHAGPDHWNDADMMESRQWRHDLNEDRAFHDWSMLLAADRRQRHPQHVEGNRGDPH
jgi:alpha-galactosidase